MLHETFKKPPRILRTTLVRLIGKRQRRQLLVTTLLGRRRQRKRVLAVSHHDIRARVGVFDLGDATHGRAAVVGVGDEEIGTLGVRDGSRGGAVGQRAAVAQVGCLAGARRSGQVGGYGRRGRGSGWGGGGAIAGVDGDGSAVHVEFLLAVEPGPGEDGVAGGDIGGDVEVEVLLAGVFAALAVGAVALPGRGDLEGFAFVDGEADLAGPAVVVADAGHVEVLFASGGPGGYRCTLRGAELLEIATAGVDVFTAAAVVGELEALIGGIGQMRVVGRTEGRRVNELHVSEG